MDECEALCDELAIIKDGEVKDTVIIPWLKGKYGKGFTVMLKIKDADSLDDVDEVDGVLNAMESSGNLERIDNKFRNLLLDVGNANPDLKDKHSGSGKMADKQIEAIDERPEEVVECPNLAVSLKQAVKDTKCKNIDTGTTSAAVDKFWYA